MDVPPTTPNLTITQTFSYKDILVKKVVRAVVCSILSQIVILLIYITIANVSIFHPIEWLNSVLSVLSRVSTWVFVIIFSFTIFAQCLIYAKDYVLTKSYSSTRFQQFFQLISLHNCTLLFLHIIVAGGLVWLITSITGEGIGGQETSFLVMGGFWTGFYFYFKVYIPSKQLWFPVVQQRKFFMFREQISVLFKDSLTLSIWPTVYFVLFHYLCSDQLEDQFMFLNDTSDKSDEGSSILLWVYLWWFASLYYFNMNLMRFFFYLFLTEPVQFPIIKENAYVLTLQEALMMDTFPIVQNLACLDLLMLAQWSAGRRQLFFTLSQPGGHPHNWNALVESAVKLFGDYATLLKKSTDGKTNQASKEKINEIPTPFSAFSPDPSSYQSMKYRNLRNMSYHDDFCLDNLKLSQTQSANVIEDFKKTINDSIARMIAFLKMCFGINFLFGELPQVNIQKCLENGQLIIWASQGISELTIASLTEDKYGIVQKDLPVIVTSLVQLKQSLDQLNKVPVLSRRVVAVDDFNYRMKTAITAAVKRSLFHMCLHFGSYFDDFSMNPEILQYLRVNVMLKNCK